MTEATMPAEWKPERSKMVVTIFPENGFICVQVDPGSPQAWRREPYHSQLRRWAADNLSKGVHVLVFVNDVATLIMPNQDLPLGPMKPTDGFCGSTEDGAVRPRIRSYAGIPAGFSQTAAALRRARHVSRRNNVSVTMSGPRIIPERPNTTTPPTTAMKATTLCNCRRLPTKSG